MSNKRYLSVKELLHWLKRQDPDATVILYNAEYGAWFSADWEDSGIDCSTEWKLREDSEDEWVLNEN